MVSIQNQDIKEFVNNFEYSNRFAGKTICITGATGLIGSILAKCLLSFNENVQVFCPVRNKEKANVIFGKLANKMVLVEENMDEFFKNTDVAFDYVIHCASPTSGVYMKEHPVETYNFIMGSTNVILDYAERKHPAGVVYVSSLEYYGQVLEDRLINEDDMGYVDPTDARSSYPLGKRAAEYLCVSYAKEYGVPVKIARLAQTFGAGVSKDDNRMFAQFARSIINGDDIVLHTTGESAKPYCYTIDCVIAILYILLKGENGEAYNVANQETYISVKDLAVFLRNNFNPNIDVRVEEHPEMGYAPVTKLRLSTHKLEKLGWKPRYNLLQMFCRLIDSMK